MKVSLLKKDLLLLKGYLIFSIIFTVAAPIFINSQINSILIKSSSFFYCVIILELILYETIESYEDKYNSYILLCTTPYTRNDIVKSKYIFILFTYFLLAFVYIIFSFLVPSFLPKLTIFIFTISLLIVSSFFSIIIPLEFKFGFEKTKYICLIIICLVPFIGPSILRIISNMNINTNLSFIYSLSNLIEPVKIILIYFIIFLLIIISTIISSKIYSRKSF